MARRKRTQKQDQETLQENGGGIIETSAEVSSQEFEPAVHTPGEIKEEYAGALGLSELPPIVGGKGVQVKVKQKGRAKSPTRYAKFGG